MVGTNDARECHARKFGQKDAEKADTVQTPQRVTSLRGSESAASGPDTAGFAGSNEVDAARAFSRYDALGVIGFSLYLTWVFLLMMNPMLYRSGMEKNAVADIVTFFFLGEIVASCVAWLLSSRLMSKGALKGVVALTVVLAPAPGLGALCFPHSVPLLACAWGCAGFGAVFLLSLWAVFLSQLPHKQAILYPALAMFIEALLVLGVLYLLVPDALEAAAIVIPLLSIASFVVWGFHPEHVGHLLTGYDATKPPDGRSLVRSSGAMVANGVLIGFVIFALSVSENSLFAGIVLAAMLAATAFKIFDSTHDQLFEVGSIIKILAPTAAVGFLMLPYFGIEVKIACCVLMMLVAATNESVCWSAVSEYTRVYRLIPFANIAFGRLGDIIGTACGYLVGRLAFGTTFESGPSNSLVLCLVVIVFILLQTFFFRDNYAPFSEHQGSEIDVDQRTQYEYAPAGVAQTGRWRQKCAQFAQHYHLTPRQEEMLVMLAKGYSTSFMQDALVVSGHTVKAHIYNIYRKVDVHSRQELIERLETFKQEEEQPASVPS